MAKIVKNTETSVVVSNIETKLVAEGKMAKDRAQQLLRDYGVPYTETGKILADYHTDELGAIIVTPDTIVVVDENDNDGMKKARMLRMVIRKTRINIMKRHDELKADIVVTGRAIDQVQRIALAEITPAEAYLLDQETYGARMAQKRMDDKVEAIKQRLAPYDVDTSFYNFNEMSDEAIEKLVANSRRDYDDQKAKEAKIESDRVAAEQAVETARQKEVSEAKARAEKAEADIAIARTAQREADIKAAAIQSEIDRMRKEKDDAIKIEAERLETERITFEKQESDRATREEAETDKDRFETWLSDISGLLPEMKTVAGKELRLAITAHFTKVITTYKEKIAGL